MKHVPEELVIEILLRLPATSLLQFKCVCKSWCSIIKSSSFIAKHLHFNNKDTNLHNVLVNIIYEGTKDYYPLTRLLSFGTIGIVKPQLLPPTYPQDADYNLANINIVGSCNGLIFLYDSVGKLVLWNPTTGEKRTLPNCSHGTITGRLPWGVLQLVFGFGFDAKTNDYKVVMIHSSYILANSLTEIDVYSLKANSWRTIKCFVTKSLYFESYCNGAFSNGMYSWLALCIRGVNETSNNMEIINAEYRNEIISFDMSNEVIVTTPLPPNISSVKNKFKNSMMVFKESLSVVNRIKVKNGFAKMFDIWVLGEYGVKESWSKLFRIGPFQGIERVLGFWYNEDMVFVETSDKELLVHDVATNHKMSLQLCGFKRVQVKRCVFQFRGGGEVLDLFSDTI
ncbi:hypothetical protein FNV43_RR05588 [Rhamnella rubrinervis]|uniref:F-box domain-containing protein n=1 Tax=Rhamnella rubrinervis TaxID=2594499 RepID=A0A8K0HMF5_9ROSA|nr:hypothetical protein FNV43_RR05588 [Rhamnella rubrinervis]